MDSASMDIKTWLRGMLPAARVDTYAGIFEEEGAMNVADIAGEDQGC